MTQQDSDREAFEKHTRELCAPGDYDPDHELRLKLNGHYAEPRIHAAWEGWQAARDHYAPKLTEREAAEVISDEIDAELHVIERAVEALREDGMRSKEEA